MKTQRHSLNPIGPVIRIEFVTGQCELTDGRVVKMPDDVRAELRDMIAADIARLAKRLDITMRDRFNENPD